MVNASPDVAASTPAPSPRTQARNERSSHTDNFAALVDSNTAAYDKASSAPKPDARASSSASDDRSTSRSSRTDRSGATDRSRSRDSSDDSRRADNAASSDPTKPDTKTTDTTSGDKTSMAKSDKADSTKSAKDDKSAGVTKDTDAKSADQADSKDAGATPPVTITPNATALIAAQATTAATGPNAEGDAAGTANGTPLAIAAAAALKAKADAGTATTQTAPTDQTGTAEAAQTGVAADPKLAALAAQANGAKADAKTGTKTDGTAKSEAKGEATTTTTAAKAAAAQAATANATTGTPVPPQPGQTTPDGQPAGDAKLAHALAGAGDDASPKGSSSHLKPDAALPQAQVQSDANTMLPQPPIAVPQHLQPAATNGVNAAAASQLTATNAANAPVPVEGLAVEIATRAKGGATRFDIRLDPAELGRIDVRIDVDRHGQVTSHLTVEKPETLQMLRQDQTQLQRALDDAGLKTGDGGLQFSLRDQSSSGQQGQQQESGRRSQRLVVSQDELPPTPIASRGYGRMLGASGGVDIRI